MKQIKYIITAFILAVAMSVQAQEVARIPVKETYLECHEQTNGTGAAVGAGVGYVAGRMLFGKGGGGLLGAAAGGLVGSQVQKPKTCYNAERVIGYKIMTKQGDKIVETYQAVQSVK